MNDVTLKEARKHAVWLRDVALPANGDLTVLGQMVVVLDDEVERLRAENAELKERRCDNCGERFDEMERAAVTLRGQLAKVIADWDLDSAALRKAVVEMTRLQAENAELRESLRRIVGHLEYEAKQGDGIADDAYDDYFAAKSFLGQTGMPKAAARGLAAIRLEIATTKPGAGT